MPFLLLVKHSLPDIRPEINVHTWHLSDEGRRRCAPLAQRLADYQPQRLVASPEPKALETAQIVAVQLNLPLITHPDLHEHLRKTYPFTGPEQFQADVQAFFAQPGQLVMGEETALQAQQRFAQTLDAIQTQYPDQNLALIAHGTVISLYVALMTGLPGYPLWKRLGLPSLVVLETPDMRLVEVVENFS